MIRPAGLIRRLSAALYDLLLLAAILMTSSFAVIVARGGTAVAAGTLAFQAFLVAQIAAFFIGFWAWRGQTLGMRTWKIRIETCDGQPLRVPRAAIRFIAALVSIAALGLGFAWILFDAEKRGWHDRLSGTRVVRVDA